MPRYLNNVLTRQHNYIFPAGLSFAVNLTPKKHSCDSWKTVSASIELIFHFSSALVENPLLRSTNKTEKLIRFYSKAICRKSASSAEASEMRDIHFNCVPNPSRFEWNSPKYKVDDSHCEAFLFTVIFESLSTLSTFYCSNVVGSVGWCE